MRAISNVQVTVDLLHSSADVAELTKLATAARWRVHLAPPIDEKGYTAVVERSTDVFLESELPYLVLLQALARGLAPSAVLSQVRSALEGANYDLDDVFTGVHQGEETAS